MFEQSRTIFKETSRFEPRMGKSKNVKKSKIAEMLEETYSADDFEERLKNALIEIHKVSVEN